MFEISFPELLDVGNALPSCVFSALIDEFRDNALIKKLLIVLGFILTLMLLSCAGLIYVDGLRDPLLAKVLGSSGVSRIDSRLRDISRDHIGLELLSLRYEQDNRVLDIDLQGVRLELLPSKTKAAYSDWKDLKSWGVSAETVRLKVSESELATNNDIVDAKPLNPADFLPEKLLSMVPLGRINATDLTVDYSPDDGAPWLIKGSFQASSAAVTSRFKLSHAQQQFVGDLNLSEQQIALTIGDQQRPWMDLQMRVELLGEQLVLGGVFQMADLTDAEHWLALVSQDIPETQAWRGHLKGAFSGSLPQTTVQSWMIGQFSQFDQVQLQTQLEGDLSCQVSLQDLQGVAFKGSASIQLQQDKLVAKLLPGSESQMHWSLDSEQIKKLTVPLVGEADQLFTLMKGQGGLSTRLNQDLSPTDIVIGLADASLAYGKRRDKLSSSVGVKRLDSILKNGVLQQIESEASFDVRLSEKPRTKGHGKLKARSQKGLMVGTLAMNIDGLAEFVTDFDYQIKQQKLNFVVSRQKATLATSTFNEWAEEFKLPFNLEVGDIELKIQGAVDLNAINQGRQQAIHTEGHVVVTGWEGKLEKNRFRGLDSSFDFAGDLSQVKVTGEVSNGLFDIGIPVTDTRYKLELSADLNSGHYRVRVVDFESKLLGGLVRIPELNWDSEQSETTFNVVVYNWQFAKLIDVLQRDDLHVTGILDGMFPVTVRKGEGVQIHDGLFTARKPGGVIRYMPDTSMKAYLSDQEQLKMAVDILENYHYTKLDVLLNQQTNGEQLLNLTLEGKNPKAYGGTPVNLNLNVEHNINPWLQTLTLPTQIQENWQNLDKLQQQ